MSVPGDHRHRPAGLLERGKRRACQHRVAQPLQIDHARQHLDRKRPAMRVHLEVEPLRQFLGRKLGGQPEVLGPFPESHDNPRFHRGTRLAPRHGGAVNGGPARGVENRVVHLEIRPSGLFPAEQFAQRLRVVQPLVAHLGGLSLGQHLEHDGARADIADRFRLRLVMRRVVMHLAQHEDVAHRPGKGTGLGSHRQEKGDQHAPHAVNVTPPPAGGKCFPSRARFATRRPCRSRCPLSR
jgi:hypothetical protein